MTTDTSAHVASTVTSEGAALRTLKQRRRRVWRSVLLVIGLMLAMLSVSVINRDRQAIESCRERMEYAVREFQRQFDEKGISPSALPLPPGATEAGVHFRDHVLYNFLYTESARAEVGVCCCRYAHSRLFQPSGRHVMTFSVKRGQYELKWMNEEEFRRQADDLDLRVRARP